MSRYHCEGRFFLSQDLHTVRWPCKKSLTCGCTALSDALRTCTTFSSRLLRFWRLSRSARRSLILPVNSSICRFSCSVSACHGNHVSIAPSSRSVWEGCTEICKWRMQTKARHASSMQTPSCVLCISSALSWTSPEELDAFSAPLNERQDYGTRRCDAFRVLHSNLSGLGSV